MKETMKKVLAQNLLQGEQTSKEGTIKMSPGMLLSTALYLADNILPKVETRLGSDSHDYKQLLLAVNACLWAVELLEDQEKMKSELFLQRQLLKWTREQCEHYESELLKFTTVKELLERDTLEMYADIVKGEQIDYIKQRLALYDARNKLGI